MSSSSIVGLFRGLAVWMDCGIEPIAAPLQSFGGQDLFPTVIEKIARLGYGLAANHAFNDGNKRIGAMMVQLLLKWNGYHLKLQHGELADMFIAIADGKADEEELFNWMLVHLQP